MSGLGWVLIVATVLVIVIGIGLILYQARPIPLSLLLDMGDMILPRFGAITHFTWEINFIIAELISFY